MEELERTNWPEPPDAIDVWPVSGSIHP
jgi:hypothetical protein